MALKNFLPLDFMNSILSGWRGGRSLFNLNIVNASTRFNTMNHDREKLAIVLSNPAVLKVFCLQCDLFSMGKVKVKKNDKELDKDPFLDFIKNPNPFQSEAQFLWDFMFWLMIGNCNTYVDSKIVNKKGNKMYHLEPHKMKWPERLQNNADHLIFSDAEIISRNKETITYKYRNNDEFRFTLDRLIISNDLTNGVGNFYKGGSRLDALYKVVSNSEAALDSKNINIRYAGKFLVGSNSDVNKMGLSEEEKTDIIDKMEGNEKRVFPLKTMVEIRRFVENLRVLELGDAYQEDFFIVGGMYNIPKDVLEAYIKSSTFENQEKARMAHVAYTLQPKGEQWMDSFERHFGYTEQNKNITISWDHLPMMNVFKESEANFKKTQTETLKGMLALGIPLDECNEFLGTNFTIEEPKQQDNGTGQQQQGQQGGTQGSGQGQSQDNQGAANGQQA